MHIIAFINDDITPNLTTTPIKDIAHNNPQRTTIHLITTPPIYYCPRQKNKQNPSIARLLYIPKQHPIEDWAPRYPATNKKNSFIWRWIRAHYLLREFQYSGGSLYLESRMSMSIHHLIRMTDLALFPVFFYSGFPFPVFIIGIGASPVSRTGSGPSF